MPSSLGHAISEILLSPQRNSVRSLPELTGTQKGELIGIGFVGGILSAILGNGID